MINSSPTKTQIQTVHNFQELISTPFHGKINTICWTRQLVGDFAEIVDQIELNENIVELHPAQLQALQLSEQGQLAREILLKDWQLLTAHGAAPTLNLIKAYERDDSYPYFPTDVYSFHIDRSPIPVDTILCTYYGETSEILPNAQAQQKVLVPEIRAELKKIYDGAAADFDAFLEEYFFDLHYLPNLDAQPISLGLGDLCRLAIEHPESKVPPCLHRAPMEKDGRTRLLLIC